MAHVAHYHDTSDCNAQAEMEFVCVWMIEIKWA